MVIHDGMGWSSLDMMKDERNAGGNYMHVIVCN